MFAYGDYVEIWLDRLGGEADEFVVDLIKKYGPRYGQYVPEDKASEDAEETELDQQYAKIIGTTIETPLRYMTVDDEMWIGVLNLQRHWRKFIKITRDTRSNLLSTS